MVTSSIRADSTRDLGHYLRTLLVGFDPAAARTDPVECADARPRPVATLAALMVTPRLLRDPLPLLAVLIGMLLAGLALLQHHWLAAVSAAERTRMRSSAAGRAEAFARDIRDGGYDGLVTVGEDLTSVVIPRR